MLRRPLYLKSLRDHARGIAGWVGGIILIVVVQLSVYPTIRDSAEGWSQLTKQFPKALQEIFRMSDYGSERGYLSTELLSFIVPFIFIGLGCTWGARVTTEDEESGAADVALGLPISRHSYVATRMSAMLSVLLLAGVSFFCTLSVGARMLHMSISLSDFAVASLTLTAVAIFFASLATCFGALWGKRTMALGLAMSTAIALFILYSLAPLVDFLEPTTKVNPMQWTIGSQPLTNGFDPAYMFWTLALSVLFGALTFVLYQRRDIAS